MKTTNKAPRLPQPEGRVFGFVDTKSELDLLCRELEEQGRERATFTILEGNGGLRRIDRLSDEFFFSDPEDQLLEFARNQLKLGHYAIGLPVRDRDEAVAVSELANRRHGHDFQYMGVWVAEKLPETD